MGSLLEIQQMLLNFSLDRPTMEENNSDDLKMYQLLRNEVDEAEAETDPQEIAREISDIVIFALTIANNHGIDLEPEIREKIAFNICRYTSDKFQDGDYDQARLKAKQDEREFVKRDFYEI